MSWSESVRVVAFDISKAIQRARGYILICRLRVETVPLENGASVEVWKSNAFTKCLN